MQPPNIYLFAVSYLAKNVSRLLRSTRWLRLKKVSGMGVSRAALAAALALMVCASVASAAPYGITTTECDSNADVGTLCERCAKSTKSPLVYPMCCEDKEAAREWCDRYLNFGIQ